MTGIASSQQVDKANEEGRGLIKRGSLEKWDSEIVQNPHKGWEVHFYDNGITKYGIEWHPEII
jgi:hypothetical protein